jgi:GMP synthase (glutamine-hydrolysing)
MKIHCIRHEPFEGLACIEDWISRNNHELSCTYTYLQQSFPTECSFDLLIIMGGTASIYKSLQDSWYLEEKQFLENCIDQKKKMLGICLGSQILASILGSNIYPGKAKEIGWFPVAFNKENNNELQFLPDSIDTFHWHGDTFDIPKGAVRLASSELTPNQGFVYNNHVFALQFHPEMTKTSLKKIIRAAGGELAEKGEFIQTADQILSRWDLLETNNSLIFEILDKLAKQ